MCILFAFPIRIWLQVLFFTQIWQNRHRKKTNNGKRREKEREKSKGRLIVLLIQLSSVLFTHLTYYYESVAFLWILFTTYFDFYEFYSSLSPSFWMKSVQFEIDSEFISNALRQCRIIGVI